MEHRLAYETARLRLARYRMETDQSRSRAAAHSTQVSAEALEVERVGVWLFKSNMTRLVCANQYIRSTREHSSGQELEVTRYPRYLRALQEHRVLAADNARSDEHTSELTESYLEPLGITSMMDASIIQRGRVIGVVCHEHVGPPRCWSERDIAFAGTVADTMTLACEQADRLDLEAALQEQTLQRLEHQKMEALGRMARAVAHDFNNLLTVVQGTVSLLAHSIPPKMEEHVREVTSMVEVARRLTQQLQSFGRDDPDSAMARVDVRGLLERLEPIIRAGLGSGIRFVIELRARDALVAAEPSQLEQVVLNLCLNARDAITKGVGQITVTVRDPVEEDELASDQLVVEVRDTGVGMSEATRERIFEPFFTTKDSGTGLGLATVYGVVQRLGGLVRVASKPGEGTLMLVALPRALDS